MANRIKTFSGTILELEEKLKELKASWPAHSVKPEMIREMEELEEQIELLKQKTKDEN